MKALFPEKLGLVLITLLSVSFSLSVADTREKNYVCKAYFKSFDGRDEKFSLSEHADLFSSQRATILYISPKGGNLAQEVLSGDAISLLTQSIESPDRDDGNGDGIFASNEALAPYPGGGSNLSLSFLDPALENKFDHRFGELAFECSAKPEDSH